jgi:hypothetical protein
MFIFSFNIGMYDVKGSTFEHQKLSKLNKVDKVECSCNDRGVRVGVI